MARPVTVAPWLRWVGGKRALAPLLVEEIARLDPALYVEPFLGGGAVALALPVRTSKLLGDANPVLVDSWLCVKQYPDALIRYLRLVEDRYGNEESGYLAAREQFNRMVLDRRSIWIERSAHLLYLNARCFNGLWRTNAHGLFNTSYGKIQHPRQITAEELGEASAALRHVTIRPDRFERVLGAEAARRLQAARARRSTALRGVAVYADPPYHDTFNDYARDGFTEDDQAVLASTLETWASLGAAVWASNSDTPLIRHLYRWASIEIIDEQHNVGATADRRGKRPCVLIRGGASLR